MAGAFKPGYNAGQSYAGRFAEPRLTGGAFQQGVSQPGDDQVLDLLRSLDAVPEDAYWKEMIRLKSKMGQ